MRLTLLLAASILVGLLGNVQAQTTILDFEAPATSTSFFYFGSTLDGTTTGPVANPDMSGINTSDSVMIHEKPTGSQTWAGAFSDPNPTTPVDVTAGNMICMKVWLPAAGNVQLKLEQSSTGGSDWEVALPVATGGEWVEVCWDPSTPSDANPGVSAAGNIYNRVVIFFDFGTSGTGATYYFDDLVVMPAMATTCNTILDFEAPATSTGFFYFGSSIDGTITGPVANPDKSGINTSDSVMIHDRPSDAQVFAGAFSDPNPTTPIDVTGGGDICVKVWLPDSGNVQLKLEQSSTGGSDWELLVPVSTSQEWVEVCFDPNLASSNGSGAVAAGNVYARMVIFFDFGEAGDGVNSYTYYFDDVCVQSSGGSGTDSSEVTFSLNLNEYTGTGVQPYVSGTFNGWSGTANPLDDTDGDGIWETTITMANGAIEYKFQFDDWAIDEQFNGKEVCTQRDPSGAFVNRAATINGDATLGPVCWNSCYNCGESVTITWNVGFPSATTASDSVYLAGGAFFGAPGGEFLFSDDDGDGIYTMVIEREIGYNTFYTFANGNCPDYSCKEDISGQACANPGNFNDRFLPAVSADTVINTCFGVCSDVADCTTSLRDQLVKNLFTVAPNPASQQVVISIEADQATERMISVVDLQGRTVYAATLDRGTDVHEINVADWTAGLYMIHVRQGQNFGIQKLLVE